MKLSKWESIRAFSGCRLADSGNTQAASDEKQRVLNFPRGRFSGSCRRVYRGYDRTPKKGPTMATHCYLEFYKGIPSVGERPLVAQTCDACGLLLGAKHYKRTHRNTWPRTCKTCIYRRYRSKHPEIDVKSATDRRNTQNETLTQASNYNKFWTLADLDRMVKMRTEGMTYREIAEVMNRTLFSIQGAFSRFGLSDGWPSRDEWLIKFP